LQGKIASLVESQICLHPSFMFGEKMSVSPDALFVCRQPWPIVGTSPRFSLKKAARIVSRLQKANPKTPDTL
jgi:hypothetical protein